MPAFIIIFLLAVGSVIFHTPNKTDDQPVYPSYVSSYSSERKAHRTIDYDEALDDHWDEIKEYINGTESIDVYSHKSGGTYTLDADISNGEVEIIHFENGGYIYINADLNSDGTGEGYGAGDYWDVEVDPSIIEMGAEEWADDNGLTLSH